MGRISSYPLCLMLVSSQSVVQLIVHHIIVQLFGVSTQQLWQQVFAFLGCYAVVQPRRAKTSSAPWQKPEILQNYVSNSLHCCIQIFVMLSSVSYKDEPYQSPCYHERIRFQLYYPCDHLVDLHCCCVPKHLNRSF